MGLGSIYTIGFPLFASSGQLLDMSDDPMEDPTRYVLGAYPKTWKSELGANIHLDLPEAQHLSPSKADTTGVWLSNSGDATMNAALQQVLRGTESYKRLYSSSKHPLIFHIGCDANAVGAALDHPGWSSHLPTVSSTLVCPKHQHNVAALDEKALSAAKQLRASPLNSALLEKLLRFKWSRADTAPDPAPIM
jgi:hypothetical protein